MPLATRWTLYLLLLAFSSVFNSTKSYAKPPVQIAIIIDDLGYNYHRGMKAIQLPAAVTFSFLPYSRYAAQLADLADQSGKEVMLHLPMQNIANTPIGEGGLTDNLNQAELVIAVDKALASVPHVRGINNHMGSALTQHLLPMDWLMDELHQLDLYFVDSRTTPYTVAATVAKQKHLHTASRDVFLDNDASLYAIDQQFQRLLFLAKQNGSAIAIGHPYPETLTYLELALPQLSAENIEIVPVSTLLALRKSRQLQLAEHKIKPVAMIRRH